MAEQTFGPAVPAELRLPRGVVVRARLARDGGTSVAVADEFSRPSATAPAYDRHAAAGPRRRAERARRHAALARTRSPTSSRSSRATTSTARPTQTVFDAILDLYGRGEPADAITVAAELNRRRRAAADRRRALPAHADRDACRPRPTPATTRAIVAERAVLRRLVEAGTRDRPAGLRRRGGNGRRRRHRRPRPAGDLRRHRAADQRGLLAASADILQPTLDEIEAIGARGGVMTGVPTGFTDLDRADQRPAPRPADHRRGPPRPGQVHARRWTSPAPRRSSTTCRAPSSRSK